MSHPPTSRDSQSRPPSFSQEDLASAREALVKDLRVQIVERIRGQQQLVVVAPAVAGAVASFAGHRLTSHPEIFALLSVLFTALALALLRHDQEVTVIAAHLTDEDALGAHASAQRQWERRKVFEMQGTPLSFVMSGAQAVGIYGMPVLGSLTFAGAALRFSPNEWTWLVLSVDAVLLVIFGAAGWNVMKRYRHLKDPPQQVPAES